GLFLSFRSQAQISGNTIQNNVPPGGDGIRVVLGSALFPTAPNGVVSGNAGFGLLCANPESSVANFPAGVAPLGLPNGLTDVAGCTGFRKAGIALRAGSGRSAAARGREHVAPPRGSFH